MQNLTIIRHLRGSHPSSFRLCNWNNILLGYLTFSYTLVSFPDISQGWNMKVRSHYTSAQNPDSSPFHARKIRAPYNAYIDGYNLLSLLLPNSPLDSLSLLTLFHPHYLLTVPPTCQTCSCLRTFAHAISSVWNALPPVIVVTHSHPFSGCAQMLVS